MKRMSSLTLIGRRWFNRRCGNTYHSVEIIVDGNCVQKIDYSYGYGEQYEDTAKNWLDAHGYTPGREKRDGTPGEALWRYCERKGIIFTRTVTDVQRKKDL